MEICVALRGPPRPQLSPCSPQGIPVPSPAPACRPDDAVWERFDRAAGLT